jgi:hypothetical protein
MLDRLMDYLLRQCRRNRESLYSAVFASMYCHLPKISAEKTEHLSEKMTALCEKILYQQKENRNRRDIDENQSLY